MILTYDLSTSALQDYLAGQNWLPAGRRVLGIDKPGEGNMNLVLRVQFDTGSLILKQAPPYVNKYPTIAAPTERLLAEYAFYAQATSNPALATHLPALVGLDRRNYILAMEDLGHGSDLTVLYADAEALSAEELTMLLRFLEQLHAPNDKPATYPDNLALRQLNHEHMFIFPFRAETGFDLDTVQAGLAALARPYQTPAMERQLQPLGECYLAAGPALLHGDYYPGSWLRTPAGLHIIDPEFSFYGPPEFDLGVLAAHLQLAGLSAATVARLIAGYRSERPLDHELLQAFTGVEILRRLIGLAQLPLSLRIDQKAALLEHAANLVGYEQ